MKRIPEVLDCWFESGSMPYAQDHYPFENQAKCEASFPADFISESLDQTRGWFYSLHVLSTALFDKPAFKNCIVSGLVLASDGKKMSKSLKNYTDPAVVLKTYGADAIRLFLVHSALLKADDLRYSDEGVKEVLKSIILPLWNAYSFFVTYANIDTAAGMERPHCWNEGLPQNQLDRWILSEAEALIENVRRAMDDYDLTRAIDPILNFIDLLNNWYIRRSRRRFWKTFTGNPSEDQDKVEAYGSLYSALITLVKAAAPFMPFVTEAIWRNLKPAGEPESVHLSDWPSCNEAIRDKNLEFQMETTRKAVSMGRALRAQSNIKLRQPLMEAELVTRNADERAVLLSMEDLIAEELNVKKVHIYENEERLVTYEAKANFKVLGKELGKDMKAAATAISALGQQTIAAILDGTPYTLTFTSTCQTSRQVCLTAEKLDVRRIEKAGLKIINEGSLTAGLDVRVTPELAREGDARDLIRGIQNLRKESGFEVTDRIILSVSGSPRLREAWEAFSSLVSSETLTERASWVETIEGAFPDKLARIEAGEETWLLSITKAE
jgi:isoleucyl-tRNA synthetase